MTAFLPGFEKTARPDWIGSAEFSPCGHHRRRLDRWWSDEPRALVCGCNPSDAGSKKNDPTVWRLFDLLTGRPGIGGFTVVNWEDYVAPHPSDLAIWRRDLIRYYPERYQAIRDANLSRIRSMAEAAPVRIIAWGNLVPPDDEHTALVLDAMSLDGTHDLHAFEITPQDRPKHPGARGLHRIASGLPLPVWRPARRIAA